MPEDKDCALEGAPAGEAYTALSFGGAPPAPLWRRFLLAGDVYATRVPHQLITVLGSCVAVCLWDLKERSGGMNHFMLSEARCLEEISNKYGDIATRSLLRRMEALGSKRCNLRAKIYGGGNVLHSTRTQFATVGRDNILVARRVLAEEGIEVLSEHVGDYHGRKLLFNTYTGEITISIVDNIDKRLSRDKG